MTVASRPIVTYRYSLRGDYAERIVDVWKQNLYVNTRHQTRTVVNNVELLHKSLYFFRWFRQLPAVACRCPLFHGYLLVLRPNQTRLVG